MRTERAIVAGIVGAVAMSLAMAVARLLGIGASLEPMLGSMFGIHGAAAWIAGFVLHLIIGAVAALGYAVCFEYALQRSGPLVGAALGVAHGLMAGLFMSAIPMMNPLVTPSRSGAGPFLENLDFGPALFIGVHAVFGAVVGAVYGHVRHEPHLIRRSRPA
jgi:hypothetical protein